MATQILVALVVGTVMSFFGSMPIAGPVAVLVLERGLVRRGREGLGVALGAAAAETLYAFLAFWGLGAALQSAPNWQRVFRLVGASLMIVLGIYLATRKTPPRLPGVEPHEGQKRRGFLLGLSVTMLNPTIIVTWGVATATVHSTGKVATGFFPSIAFALGVGLGIVAWFYTMLRLIQRFQSGWRPQTVDRVLNVTGWVVVGIGVALGARPFAQMLGWVAT